jgi:ABC-type transporter Mla subunit MlaD
MELLRSRYAAVFEELNPQFAELIRNFEGTSSELATLIDQLAGVYATIDALTSSDVLGDAATLYANSIGGIARAVENNISNLDAAIAAYDGTASSVAALTNATIEYYNAAAAAIAQTMAIGKAIDEMFGNTRRNIEMSGLDTQGQYNYLQAEADRLFEQLLGSSDPTDIQRLAERINNDISSAFGLLSPEEQAQMSQQFLDRIDSVNQAVQDRLKEITEGMAEQTRTDLARIRELFEGVAAENAGAAAKMSVAGDVMLEAARTPQTLYIVNGNSTEVGGGGA